MASTLGLIAGLLTTLSMAPQVYKSWKTKQTKDLSWVWLSILIVGIILWLIYGIIIKDAPLILANSFTFVLVFILIILKYTYEV